MPLQVRQGMFVLALLGKMREPPLILDKSGRIYSAVVHEFALDKCVDDIAILFIQKLHDLVCR